MHQRIPVLTAEAPFRRYAPHPDPMLLEDGAFADVQNVVIDQGVPRVREGMGEFLGTGTSIPDGEFYGGGIFEFGSGRIAVRAIWDGSHIRIEYNVANPWPSWGGWGEATHASGQGGDTRMSRPDLGLVQFQMVPASNHNSARIIIQTGNDLPRMMAIGDPGTLRIVRPVEPPSGIESHPAIGSVSAYVNYAAGSPTASHSSDPTDYFDYASVEPGPNRFYDFGAPASGEIKSGEWAQVVYSAPDKGDFSHAKQAFLLFSSNEENDPYPWLRHKIYLLIGATPTPRLIFDPNDASFSAIQVSTGTSVLGEVILSAFNLEGLGDGLNDVRGVRFEAVENLTDPTRFALYGILAGGQVNGAASYKVSHYSNWMHSESPGVTLRYGASARVGDYDAIDRLELALGESTTAAKGDLALPGVPRSYVGVKFNISLPIEPTLYYEFLVPVLTPTQGEGEHGVDEARVYRRDPGEGQYSLVTWAQTAEYSGGWTFSDNEIADIDAWNQRVYMRDNVPREGKSFEIPAPSAQNTSVPQGYAMALASSRLYVGASKTEDSYGGQSVVYASELDLAMRFRNVNASAAQTIADREAFVVGLAHEDALALRASATSAVGIEGLYCWTSKALYRLSDLRAERIGAEGISAPDSAAEKNGLVMWLDNQNELQGFAGNTTNLSRSRVESVLKAVPAARRKFGVGVVWKDFYYLAHTPDEGDENVYALAYSMARGQFEGRHLLPEGKCPAQFQPWELNGDARMLYWDKTGRLWEWMKPGQAQDDDDIPIVLSLTTKRYRSSPNGRMAFRRTQIVADDCEATWTVTHDVQGPDATVVGAIVMPDAGSESPVQVYDSTPGGSTSPIGGAGYSLQTTLSAELPAGTRLCEWLFEGREVRVAAGSPG